MDFLEESDAVLFQVAFDKHTKKNTKPQSAGNSTLLQAIHLTMQPGWVTLPMQKKDGQGRCLRVASSFRAVGWSQTVLDHSCSSTGWERHKSDLCLRELLQRQDRRFPKRPEPLREHSEHFLVQVIDSQIEEAFQDEAQRSTRTFKTQCRPQVRNTVSERD